MNSGPDERPEWCVWYKLCMNLVFHLSRGQGWFTQTPPSNHKVFKPENFTLKETQGLISSQALHNDYEVTEGVSQGAGGTIRTVVLQGTQPGILTQPRELQEGLPKASDIRAPNLECPSTLSLLKWLTTRGKRSKYTVKFPRINKSALENYL